MRGITRQRRTNPLADRNTIALALLTAAESAQIFVSFLPSPFAIRSFAPDESPADVQQKVAMLRSGYAPAITFGLGLGAVVSLVARSPLPLVASAATTLAMRQLYEHSITREYH